MKSLPILCYHHVDGVPRDAAHPMLYVEPARFERHLFALRRLGLRGVSLTQGLADLDAPGPCRSVVITFDDGYADTLEHAAPILRTFGFGATCYVVTGCVGTTNSWDSAERRREQRPLMDLQQLERWLSLGFEIGSHSHLHRALNEVDDAIVLEDVAASREYLLTQLGVDGCHFSYPFGRQPRAGASVLRNCGYRTAVGIANRFATAACDRFALPRLIVDGRWGEWQLLRRLALPWENWLHSPATATQ